MEYIHNTEQFQFHNTVVALGKFDGMHKGHQLIFDELIQYKHCLLYTSEAADE